MSDAVNSADTQRQLNIVVDPIGARLPVEISSEIFILCLPDSRDPNPRTAPLLLLRICTMWANIARSTPALWDTLHVHFPRAEGFEHLFDSYLARSKSRRLALTLTGQFDQNISALLCAHTHRMQQLGSASTVVPAGSMNLKALKFSPNYDLDLMGVLCMLRAAPGLVECTIANRYRCHDIPPADSLTLPCLQSLSMGDESYLADLRILEYLSVPALRCLTIMDIVDHQDVAFLVSFLTRLEAPLQSLHVEVFDMMLQPEVYTRLLDLVPTLTSLWLTLETASQCMLVLDLLRRSPQGFIPELRDLTFSAHYLDESDFRPLYDLLSARRSQIKSFRFFINEDAYGRLLLPPPDVLPPLRQLAAECGMKIHVGSPDTNYI
ncbi:hypothetical protein C8J57DRAFT_299320 [Mycena rebaudengoi]|nr:hypothetical protein C8J57DRAFT_299320 [Mycena rebaudengoi]